MQISDECLICQEYISKLRWRRVFANFTSSKGRIALQVARKIAPCDRAFKLGAVHMSRASPANRADSILSPLMGA